MKNRRLRALFLWSVCSVKVCYFWLMRAFFIVFLLIHGTLHSQTPADSNKRFNEVTFLATHNAYNTRADRYRLPNQAVSVADQLKAGVRGLLFDVYENEDSLFQYHRHKFLRKKPFHEGLNAVRTFLKEDSTAIVTLILECYTSVDKIERELRATGLYDFLFWKDSRNLWPTINEMLQSNQRLVIFTNRNDASPEQTWYLSDNEWTTATHYSNFRIKKLSSDLLMEHRADGIFLMNHFVYSWLGTGSRRKARKINTPERIQTRIDEIEARYGRTVNFVAVDYFEGVLRLR